jgi:hypothetical protein
MAATTAVLCLHGSPSCRCSSRAGYSRANSPPLSVSLATLRIFANQYPERLERVYFVDAPAVFSLLFGGWRRQPACTAPRPCSQLLLPRRPGAQHGLA